MQAMSHKKNLFISVLSIILVLAFLCIGYNIISNQNAKRNISQILRKEISVRGITLENDIQTDIAIAKKLITSPLIITFFQNPSDTVFRQTALEELNSYQSAFSSNNIFWLSDVDKQYYYNGEYVYTLDPTIPESAWYGQALNGEKDLSFNMSYDIGIKKMQLWINAIVKNGTVPVGITGTGITLNTFIEKCFFGLDESFTCCLFNENKEVTGAIDKSLLDTRTLVEDVYGKNIPFEKIMQEAKACAREKNSEVCLFTVNAKERGAICYLPSYDWYFLATAPVSAGKEKGISALLITTIFLWLVFIFIILFISKMQTTMKKVRLAHEKEKEMMEKINSAREKELSLQKKEREMGNRLFEETQNLAVATKETAATSQDSAAAVKEIVATMEDTNALSENISRKIKDVSSVANTTSSDVVDGVAQIELNVKQLHEIFDANQQTIDGIKTLSEKIESIWDIVTLINNVADQAKIIAFNAELEASTAGEAGKSFRIVANEIRRLSDGIIDGTHEIKEKINEIQHSSDSLILASESSTEKINSGYENARGLSEKFESIKKSAEITAKSADDIADIIQQQASASEQILIAIKEIASGVENFTVATDNISGAAENVRKISEELNNAEQE